MFLALGLRCLHQRRLVELFGARQNGTGDFDGIVTRQRIDEPWRRIRYVGELNAELGAGGLIYFLEHAAHDVVEQADMLVGQFGGTGYEKLGDGAKQLGANCDVLVRHRLFKRVDQRLAFTHGLFRLHQAT